MTEKRKVACLLSGGVDSTTLATYFKSLGFDVYAMSIDYGQRHSRELEAAKAVAKYLGLPHTIVKIGNVYLKSALTDSGIHVPEGDYSVETQRITVVPNRNMIMLSILAGYAISNDISFIAYGAHYSDYAVYPDCRPEFVCKMNHVLKAGNEGKEITLLAPFIHFTKGEIVALGSKLGAPYHLTYSCYNGGEKHCGRCGTCRERLQAFRFAGVKDPVEYESIDI